MLPIRVLIADDHEIVLDGYVSILTQTKSIEVVAKANNGKEVMEQLQSHAADVILLDLNMPVMDGIEATPLIKAQFPQVKIIILTMFDDASHIKQLIGLGVNGYLLKNTDKNTLIRAIESVHEGKSFFDSEITKTIVNGFKQRIQLDDEEIILSERELEIIVLIASGKQTSEISEALFISPHTVKTHRKNINLKLGIHSPAELILFAKKRNLIN